MTAARGDCPACCGGYVLRTDGKLRAHRAEGRMCPGSGQPPKAPAPAAPARPLPASVLACEHAWSGWTRLPFSTSDFRQCSGCGHVELQERQPCALCAAADARAYEIPDYGTAYVCAPCLQAAA